MSKFICKFTGVRGRKMEVYDNKCVITTDLSVGSVLTNNFYDGEKTIFYKDVIGIQFKKSKLAIGYLQLETASGQMNNLDSNMFSENTFTFEEDSSITNAMMEAIKNYIVARVEGYKYDTSMEESDRCLEEFEMAKKKNVVDGIMWECKHCGAKTKLGIYKCSSCGKNKS